MHAKPPSTKPESSASDVPPGEKGALAAKSQTEGRPGRGSWSPHSETVSLGFVVVLAALGCTCGFERWPTGEARVHLNLLLDVTEGAFVPQESKASLTGPQTGFPLDISVVRLCPFDSFIFKCACLCESGTFLGDRFLLLGLCVAGIAEGSVLGDGRGPFPACGYVETRIPGNSCRVPNSFCPFCCGSMWRDNVMFH